MIILFFRWGLGPTAFPCERAVWRWVEERTVSCPTLVLGVDPEARANGTARAGTSAPLTSLHRKRPVEFSMAGAKCWTGQQCHQVKGKRKTNRCRSVGDVAVSVQQGWDAVLA